MTYSCWKRLGCGPEHRRQDVVGVTILGVHAERVHRSFYGVNGDLLTSLSKNSNNADWFTQRDSPATFF